MTKYLSVLDSWFGKGLFYTFWGFLMYSKMWMWMIFSIVFIVCGGGFMAASCFVSGPMHHFCNSRPDVDPKANYPGVGEDVRQPGV